MTQLLSEKTIMTTSYEAAIHVRHGADLAEAVAQSQATPHPDHDLRWLSALSRGLDHDPYLLEAIDGSGRAVARLPLCFVRSRLFGRFLVSLPYVSSGGIWGNADDSSRRALVDQAAELTQRLNCRHLELRHEDRVPHSAFNAELDSKVHMRLALPTKSEVLWNSLNSKVRNQVRKGQGQQFDVRWGGIDLLDSFYAVFSRNMRDLGTPVFGRRLFASIVEEFDGAAEFCVVAKDDRAVAAALLVHGTETTVVPSASSLREFNSLNPNMLMYWCLLERAIERGQRVFDFGRSTSDSNTYRFKKQWGAMPVESCWQYLLRRGSQDDMRPDNAKFRLMIKIWQRLPLSIANFLGPGIVRGIP